MVAASSLGYATLSPGRLLPNLHNQFTFKDDWAHVSHPQDFSSLLSKSELAHLLWKQKEQAFLPHEF
jgi:hypothetical protein